MYLCLFTPTKLVRALACGWPVKSFPWPWGLAGSRWLSPELPYIPCTHHESLDLFVVGLRGVAWAQVEMTDACWHRVSETPPVS